MSHHQTPTPRPQPAGIVVTRKGVIALTLLCGSGAVFATTALFLLGLR